MPQMFLRLLTPAIETDDGFDMAAQWLIRDIDGTTLGEGTTDGRGLSELVNPDEAWVKDPQNILVFVPVDNVVFLSCRVPGRSLRQIRRALPYAVEDFLTQDVETMHLAHGVVRRNETVDCLLIDDELLRSWVSCLNKAGLTPGVMIPDASALPTEGVTASVLFELDGALIRTSSNAANINIDLLPEVLRDLNKPRDPIDQGAPKLNFINGHLNDPEVEASSFTVEQIIETHLQGSVLEYLASEVMNTPIEVNFLQGQYAPAKRKNSLRQYWRATGGLAAIWALTFVVVSLAEALWTDHQSDLIREEAEIVYKKIYGNETRVLNPYRQMRGHLNTSETINTGFHAHVGQLAIAIDDALSELNLSSLKFNAVQNELVIEAWLPGYTQLDTLKTELERKSFSVEIESAEEQNGKVRSSLRMRFKD